MYSVRLGFDAAKNRIRKLVANGHHAEALLTSVFTFEKTVHRTLKQLMVSAGFRNEDADRPLKQIRGFQKQTKIWLCFDPNGKSLPDIIGNKHWQHVSKAVEMRNDLVHGSRVYSQMICKDMAEHVLELLDQTVEAFRSEYGYDGWATIAVRRSAKLHVDPKVNV